MHGFIIYSGNTLFNLITIIKHNINHVILIPRYFRNKWIIWGLWIFLQSIQDLPAAFLGQVSASLWRSGKHISLWGASVDAAAHCCGPAGSAPLYYASQWEHHRKVSVTRLWHLQCEGSKTLSFCFSTFPDTAHRQGHVPTVQHLQWSITRSVVCREIVGVHVWLFYVMPFSKSHLLTASVGLCHIFFQQMTKYAYKANIHRPICLYTQHLVSLHGRNASPSVSSGHTELGTAYLWLILGLWCWFWCKVWKALWCEYQN